jgi:hypothetical protein
MSCYRNALKEIEDLKIKLEISEKKCEELEKEITKLKN